MLGRLGQVGFGSGGTSAEGSRLFSSGAGRKPVGFGSGRIGADLLWDLAPVGLALLGSRLSCSRGGLVGFG